ncbi:acyl-CoA thioesterase [Pikeienuella piscinae]|uniref:Acyl-CoA thioesterase n=1 Tax=Pikeienuella piscinae TaxID=2748098 RepID=A0A7L5C375_9RHOB|nr:thioesterase family protein [Pikeienuella piscinae]QIE56319.1 acyl-CoA thioesterase [Pikeienuella piscinae]
MTITPTLDDIGGYSMFEPVTLRFSDQDAMGHVNNVAYAALFESGRLALLTDLLAGLDDRKLGYVLANLTIDYRKEMHFPGAVQVGGRLLRVGEKSLTTGYGAFLNGVCHATATSVNVCFDIETRRARPFPAEIRAALLARIDG